jgi:hypothetical protein
MRYAHAMAILIALSFVPGFSALLRAQDGPASAGAAGHVSGSVQITEFMAVNNTGLDDEDRDESDWIEIYNAGPGPANLEGWYLTDKADNLTKWKFPAVTLAADAYLVVFASGKDRRDPAHELHTNFRLSGSGEYLGLVRPDGVTVASEFAPFPIQAPDVSYGLDASTFEQVLLTQGAPARALVPQDDALEPPPLSDAPRPWTLEDFDDSAWLTGVTGIGYGYWKLVGLDVEAVSAGSASVYVRVPFVVEDPSVITSLTLRMWHDDGMIAYINGQEVARDNAPEPGTETWNSGALAPWPGTRVPTPVDFPIHRFDFLHVGTNLLAVQGLNYGGSNPDLLVLPELLARAVGTEPSFRYFPVPTPGRANDLGVETLGPIITDEEHRPSIPTEGEGLQVTARISPASAPLASAQLHYRVMFDAEVTTPFLDDGASGDGSRDDGVFGAHLPAGAFRPGQMVRWYITAQDTAGQASRFPAYLDPLNSPQYCGTVVLDPSLRNPLPVLHWFIQNPGAADSDAGTRCSLFYDGEFYDNVWVNIHGQSSRGFPKKSHDVDFNPGHNFKWEPNQPRADDINLMTTYPDKAQMRNILAYETYRDADCPYHWVFPVRVQQNGEFWGTAHVMENGDKDWLIRMGVNADGALYKMYNTFTSPSHATSGAEKKTRKNEDNADLLALYNGVTLSGEARRRYLYDNVDVAQVVDFLAARIITGDTDCCHKNYYLYRDTGRSNEWQMWPWDVDLSFGRVWNSSDTYWDQHLHPNTPLFIGDNNRVPQAIFNTPELRQMYLRRVRTLMDELLMPPDTPVEALHYEPRIDELAAQLAPDAALDAAKWRSDAWGNGSTASRFPQSLPEAAAELKNSYLPERRRQLFNRLAPRSGEIPDAQPAGATILFAAIETGSASGNRDEQYIQLQNPNGFAVDISGWTLSVGDSVPFCLFTFRGGTVIPAQGFLYVAANRPAFRARRVFPTGDQALFIVGDFAGWLASQPETLTLTDRQGQQVASTHTR